MSRCFGSRLTAYRTDCTGTIHAHHSSRGSSSSTVMGWPLEHEAALTMAACTFEIASFLVTSGTRFIQSVQRPFYRILPPFSPTAHGRLSPSFRGLLNGTASPSGLPFL